MSLDYQNAVLADNPVLYIRADEVGPDSDGATWPDLSASNLTVTQVYADDLSSNPPSAPARGYFSPIETDSASREFRSWGDSGDTSGGRPAGQSHLVVASVSELEISGDWTVEEWLRPRDGGPALPGIHYVMAGKGGCYGISQHGAFGTISAFCVDSADTIWSAHSDVNATDHFGTSFYVVAKRVGNVLAIYVNDVLRAQTTITSGLSTKVNSDDFIVHTHTAGYIEAGHDEIAVYDYALSTARATVHYETALAALLLNGDSNVICSAILYSDVEPAPIEFPFRHNWDDALIERISFRTNVSTARKGYSENGVVRPKPRREIEISQVLRDNAERTRLRSSLTAQQNRKWFVPILEDREWLTSPLASGVTTIPVTAQYKDYEVDNWAELRQLNDAGVVVKSEYVELEAVNANDIVSKTATVNSYDAFLTSVSPARRAFIGSEQSLHGHSGAVEDTALLARLVAEDEKVTPNRITPWTPTLSYKTYEVFNPLAWQSNDWSELREYDVSRDQQSVDFESGAFLEVSDSLAAIESFSYRMLLDTRAQQAALLGWFYARMGAANYLWVPTMQADFAIVSAVSASLTVTNHNYSDNFAGSEFRRDLAFVYHDNTMILRRINSVAVTGADETLTLDATVPTQTNLRSVSYLRFCQMDGDTLEIARVSSSTARFAWRFRELLSSPA